MKRSWAVVLCLGLVGCATPRPLPPEIKIVTVEKPVPVSCVPADLPPRPHYPDDLLALLMQPNEVARAQLVEAGWGMRDARLDVLEGVVTACKSAPSLSTGPATPTPSNPSGR